MNSAEHRALKSALFSSIRVRSRLDSPSHRQRIAPAEADVPNGVPANTSDQSPDLSPWPVADTPGRPFIHQLKHDESARDWAYSAAIWTSVILMGVAVLLTLFDRFLDGKF